MALFLTLGGGSMIHTRRTAASGKTECLMRHLDSLGGSWREILGQELAEKFDQSFVQPIDNNDNTGEKRACHIDRQL